jgi:hypothetical protein
LKSPRSELATKADIKIYSSRLNKNRNAAEKKANNKGNGDWESELGELDPTAAATQEAKKRMLR